MRKNKKIIALGLIIFFIGVSISPLISSSPLQKNEKILEEYNGKTIEIIVTQNDMINTISQELSVEDINKLQNLFTDFYCTTNKNEIGFLLDRILDFFKERGLNLNLPNQQSDTFIVSYGKENHLLPSYVPKIKFSDFFHMWQYSTDWSTTVIMDSVISAPSNILQGRQIGFMLGFQGIYIYIPDWIPGFEDMAFFLGTTTFAWGMAL